MNDRDLFLAAFAIHATGMPRPGVVSGERKAGKRTMTPDMIAEILRQLLREALLLAMPVLLLAATVSFLLSLFQTLTSLQDQTISTVPRLASVAVFLLLAMNWYIGHLLTYTRQLLGDLHRYLG
jgi:flagellar biosynthetic protein FliQ